MSSVHRNCVRAWVLAWLAVAGLADSVVDRSFQLDPAVRGRVDAVCVRPDGRILLAGKLRLEGAEQHHVVQWDATGRLDPEFQPVRSDRILSDWDRISLALPTAGGCGAGAGRS